MNPISIAAVFATLAFPSTAAADVRFFVSPGNDPSGDREFRRALLWPIQEFGFEIVSNCGDPVTFLQIGKGLRADIRLLNGEGTAVSQPPTMFFSNFNPFT